MVFTLFVLLSYLIKFYFIIFYFIKKKDLGG